MKRSAIARSTKRIAHRSKKMSKLYAEKRVPLVRHMLGGPDDFKACELGPKIIGVLPSYDDCGKKAVCLHELQKRSQGGSITDINNVMRSCAPCNVWVEDHPLLAHKAGLVRRAGDS